MIRVLLADDHALVRGALAALLRLEPDIEVVAEAATGEEAIAVVRDCPSGVDVCLMDIEMPGMSGIEAIEQIRRIAPEIATMIVTTFGRPGYVRRALEAGAMGFLVKDTPATELARAIRQVHAGTRVVDPLLATASLAGGPSPLTPRERDVLRAALGGDSVAAIGAQIHLSPGTVRNYLSSAISKTGADNRLGAARAAEENGWL